MSKINLKDKFLVTQLDQNQVACLIALISIFEMVIKSQKKNWIRLFYIENLSILLDSFIRGKSSHMFTQSTGKADNDNFWLEFISFNFVSWGVFLSVQHVAKRNFVFLLLGVDIFTLFCR